MPEHINEQQLRGYRDRTLALGELVAVDSHLGGCDPCRKALAALADGSATASVLSGIDQARFQHLSYEQMDDWAEDRLDVAGRELIMAHIGTCPACARQLIAYQDYAPKMAEPIRTAAAEQVKEPWWAFLKQPQYAMGAAALAAFFVFAPWSRHSSPPEQIGAIIAPKSSDIESSIPSRDSQVIDEALSTTELDRLPDSLRAGAKAVITADANTPPPAALKGLKGDSTLDYPAAEVVAETQPVMRWKAFGDSTYSVTLYDNRHSMIARRSGLKETSWTAPSPLVRDRIYTWEVESSGQTHRGSFRVLSENQRQELEQVRAKFGGSHLVIGAVSEQLGLLTPAKQEFKAMASDRDQAPQAEKLLSRIDALQK